MASSTSSTMYRTLMVSSIRMRGPPRRSFGQQVKQKADARLELGGSAFESRGGGTRARANECRVGNAPVHELRVGRELGADLSDAVAQRDHEVEPHCEELVEVLGAVRADIDAPFAHDPDRVRMQRFGMAPTANGFDRPV